MLVQCRQILTQNGFVFAEKCCVEWLAACCSSRFALESPNTTLQHCDSTTGTHYSDIASALQSHACCSYTAATLQKSHVLQTHYRRTTAWRVHYSTTPRYSMDGMCSVKARSSRKQDLLGAATAVNSPWQSCMHRPFLLHCTFRPCCSEVSCCSACAVL